MNYEVNRLLFIVMMFLCGGGVLIRVLYYVFTEVLCYVHVESNGFLRDGTAGGYAGNRLDKRSRSLELEMDGRLPSCVCGTLEVQQLPETFVSECLVARKGCR